MAFSKEEFQRMQDCFKIIPTAYDDSLSYYQQIAAVLDAIISTLEKLDSIEELSHKYTDQKIAILRSELLDTIATENAKLKTLIADNTSSIAVLSEKIDEVAITAKAELNGLREEIQLYFEQYTTWILDYISQNLIDIKVINYFTGEKVTIQDMFNYLAMLHVTTGLTYSELAARNYTYNEIIEKCNTGNYSYSDLIRDAATILPVK